MNASVDPSRRFVLCDDAPYLNNMAALWAADGSLARRIESLDDEAAYRIEPSRSGPPTVSAPAPAGRPVYLHSRHQPLEEARRLVDTVKIGEAMMFHVYGLGLGYHVQNLLQRTGGESVAVVFEPDLLMLKTALLQQDLSQWIQTGRILFFTQPDKSDLFIRLTPHSAMLSLGFEALEHGPSMQLHPQFHRQMRAWIDEYIAYCRTSVNTLILNGKRTAQNIARNLAWYVAAPGVNRLKDRYRSKPAVIVSAGPSLRKNKHLLNELDDRAVLIAVQTTLRPLLEMGVEPHFVTSLDYHEICTRFFEKLPPSLRTELVAEPKATSGIFDLNPGPLTLLGNEFAENLLHEMKLHKATLTSGATVAHLAYYLAEHMGCDPIIFVGQDLGFSDGLAYAPGTSYEDVWRPELGRFRTIEMKQWEQIVRDRPILRRISDVEGRPMYTEERLFTYLQQFERDFGRSRGRIIDATEGGAMKRGALPMTLRDAIDRHCTQPIGIAQTPGDHPGLRWDRLGECIQCLEKRREEAGRIEQISRQTLPLLQEVADHLQDQQRVNRLIGRIDALRSRMNELGMCYGLILQLGQTNDMKRFESDRRIAAAAVDGIEKQRRQIHRDLQNVRGLIEAAGEFQTLMDQVLNQFAQFRPAAQTHPA